MKARKVDARAVLLAAAMFWNPLGYDAAFALAMELTGSFWKADALFYALSLSCFGLYFWLGRRRRLAAAIKDRHEVRQGEGCEVANAGDPA